VQKIKIQFFFLFAREMAVLSVFFAKKWPWVFRVKFEVLFGSMEKQGITL